MPVRDVDQGDPTRDDLKGVCVLQCHASVLMPLDDMGVLAFDGPSCRQLGPHVLDGAALDPRAQKGGDAVEETVRGHETEDAGQQSGHDIKRIRVIEHGVLLA